METRLRATGFCCCKAPNLRRRRHARIFFGLPISFYEFRSADWTESNSLVGTYRKRNNLLEASYNSAVYREVPTFDTPYVNLSIVICADMF